MQSSMCASMTSVLYNRFGRTGLKAAPNHSGRPGGFMPMVISRFHRRMWCAQTLRTYDRWCANEEMICSSTP